ncbi:MAG: hypothetical protein LUD03_04530 [Firmicutes bacterium]|nr:hypothetical protein [Bacillota bacterium]
MPRSRVNPNIFWFSEKKWEKGCKIYNKTGVSRWKNSLPDMSKYVNRLLLKRLSGGETAGDIYALIIETCVAEAAHFCLILLSAGMVFNRCDLTNVLCALFYAAGNVPYVIIQRYNRPRLRKMYDRITRRSSGSFDADSANAARELCGR